MAAHPAALLAFGAVDTEDLERRQPDGLVPSGHDGGEVCGCGGGVLEDEAVDRDGFDQFLMQQRRGSGDFAGSRALTWSQESHVGLCALEFQCSMRLITRHYKVAASDDEPAGDGDEKAD
ncbi:hypothetical protein TOPH_08803, partial [Tolypocladium ophioglossoides CBS 100239]